MKIGIIGLPSSGKTTVFNALTRGRAQPGFGGGRGANVGVAHVPDDRLGALAKIFKPRRVVNAEVTYVDLPGSHTGDMFSGEALGQLQKVDALLLVARAFHNDAVPHPDGEVDWKRDLDKVSFDVTFADIALLDRRIQRMQEGMKSLKATERDQVAKNVDILKSIQVDLENGTPVRDRPPSDAEKRAISDTFLLSKLPLLVAVNISDDDLPNVPSIQQELDAALQGSGVGGAVICGQLEMDLAQMTPEEEAEMRLGLDAGESGLSRMIRLSYRVLGLVSFLTAGEDEVRAWTIEKDETAPEAAGAVHSDISRGFIRAEVVGYDDFMSCGGLAEARTKGLLRQEGREYVVKDGDIVNFLFSV